MKRKRFLKIFSVFILIVVLVAGWLFFRFVATPSEALTNEIPNRFEKQIRKFRIHYVTSKEISTNVNYAAVASQDKRFYQDPGIDIVGTVRAIYFTLTSGQRQGASTITEQLAKNLFFHDTDNLRTDIETKTLAFFITARYPKQQILTWYLNDIYYGQGAYGIYNASRTYFQISPDKLSVSQAAYILGLINAPSILSNNKKEATNQAKNVLSEMQNNHYITGEQEESALAQLEIFGKAD